MTARRRFLREFPKALLDDAASIFVGAGVSVGAGYPSWKALLQEIGEDLGVASNDVHDLAALAQWEIRKSAGKTRILQTIRDALGTERDIPSPLDIIARLPIRTIWTTNYDRLIERAFEKIGRPIDVVSASEDLSVRARPGATKLYKMHGTVDRLSEIVISTDDYELFRSTRGAFLPLLQAHMTSLSLLFVGLSFADPNIRHVLSLIREAFHTSPPEHFAIVRPPHRDEFKTDPEFRGRLTQHKLWADDLQRYGLQVIEIESYDEVPILLQEVEKQVARQRVWISGSWPPEHELAANIAEISRRIGFEVSSAELSLVSGVGLTVGSAAVGGFLDGLKLANSWDLERRLIARPFPRPLRGDQPNREQWRALRTEMARLSGIVIFLGGTHKIDSLIGDSGIFEELDLAREAGRFVIPVGGPGGIAKDICNSLIGSRVPFEGIEAQRPTDLELVELRDASTPDQVGHAISRLLKRISSAWKGERE